MQLQEFFWQSVPFNGFWAYCDPPYNLILILYMRLYLQKVSTVGIIVSQKWLWQKHISCPNACIFLDFGYDWYFIASLLNFLREKNSVKYYLKTVIIRLRSLDNIFSCRNLNKLSIKYQSYPKSRKIDAFGEETCFCHNPIDKELMKYCYLHLFRLIPDEPINVLRCSVFHVT